MIIKYHINIHKDGLTYVTILMPQDLIKQCNFEHKDRFNITITETALSICYDVNGKYMLAKNNKTLVFNVNSKDLSNKTLELMKTNTTKTIPTSIKGGNFIMDLTKLASKPKGFNLFQTVNKGFKMVAK